MLFFIYNDEFCHLKWPLLVKMPLLEKRLWLKHVFYNVSSCNFLPSSNIAIHQVLGSCAFLGLTKIRMNQIRMSEIISGQSIQENTWAKEYPWEKYLRLFALQEPRTQCMYQMGIVFARIEKTSLLWLTAIQRDAYMSF